MNTSTKKVKLTPELAAELARMKEAYEQLARDFPSVEGDWNLALLWLRAEVAEQVQKALAAEGLKGADLARKMGVSRAYISKILNESVNFQMETIAKLSVALNRDIALRLIRKSERVVVESAARLPVDTAAWPQAMLGRPAATPSLIKWAYQSAATSHSVAAPMAEIIELSEAA